MSELVKIDMEAIVQKLRTLNQNGDLWTMDVAVAIAPTYRLSAERLFDFGNKVYAKYSNEFNAKAGGIVQKMECFFGDHYEFKRNTISSELLWRKRNTDQWSICSYNDVWRSLQHNIAFFGKKTTKIPMQDVINILESSFVPRYNPIKDYFDSLPAWDEVDHITNLANHITCDDQDYWLKMFKKTLVRMIACSYTGHENRIINVLVQEQQEQGKDTFIRFLCPPELHEYYKEDPMEPGKDTEIALAKNFMWNMAELDHLTKKEISEIKSIISQKVVKQRAAYERQTQSMQRIVNWWGSTNKIEFLTDDKNTRWLCFVVKKISWEYSKTIDIRKVWAQAWHLYKEGYDYNLTYEEKTARDEKNKSFESMPDEKQLIISYFSKASSGEGEFMTPSEITIYLTAVSTGKIRLTTFIVTKSLNQLGFHREERIMDGTKIRGYWLKKKPMSNGQTPAYGNQPITNQAELPLESPF